jgi:hypothetical protein
MTWLGIRTACERSQRRATYCVNVGQETRPVSFLCYAHPALAALPPMADGWMARQTRTDRTGQDSSCARIQCQCQCAVPCGPLATLRFIPGRTGASRRIQAQRPHRIVVGTISKSAATGELCPTLLTLCPHSLADSLTHGRGHGGPSTMSCARAL